MSQQETVAESESDAATPGEAAVAKQRALMEKLSRAEFGVQAAQRTLLALEASACGAPVHLQGCQTLGRRLTSLLNTWRLTRLAHKAVGIAVTAGGGWRGALSGRRCFAFFGGGLAVSGREGPPMAFCVKA